MSGRKGGKILSSHPQPYPPSFFFFFVWVSNTTLSRPLRCLRACCTVPSFKLALLQISCRQSDKLYCRPPPPSSFFFCVGVTEETCGLRALVREAYTTLGLQTYFTSGETETKAWTICTGWTAPQAAGVIHSDFER